MDLFQTLVSGITYPSFVYLVSSQCICTSYFSLLAVNRQSNHHTFAYKENVGKVVLKKSYSAMMSYFVNGSIDLFPKF